ncbi:MAG: hypothetical protein LBJ13_02185 [Puniceicoccales bacterium]|jgi:serine/threonine protein kinase|nr:hypothetical protein [Puniceicoccales bacterium]
MKKFPHPIVSFLSFGIHFSALSAGVNVGKYLQANPDPLDAIPENFVPELGKQLGHGSYGTVYPITNSGFENFVQKTGDIENEAEIGQRIMDMRHNITSGTQLSDIQGLELVVPGKKVANAILIQEGIQGMTNEILIQEKIQGLPLGNFVRSFKKGWTDHPKKALERLCILLNSLHALDKAGIRHNDLHAGNIMIEQKKLPDEVIAAHVEAKARQRTGIIGEEKDLTEENRQALDEAIATARANLSFEDQYEYIPRIIDFGLSYAIDKEVSEEEAPQNISRDMQMLGALMPPLLFGNSGCIIIGFGHHLHVAKYRITWEKTAKPELIQTWKDSGQPQDQLAAEIMSLEMEMNIGEMAAKKRIYEKTYGDKYEDKFKADLEKLASVKRKQYIMEKFHKANNKMRIDTGKSYPKPVLEELAQITTDCLPRDPTQCPTAEEALEKVTNLLLFTDWDNGQ